MNYGPLERFFVFNRFERDRWVAEQARRIPAGSTVLDVGAGPCRYRELFAHCVYRAQDFGRLEGEEGWTGYGDLDYICDLTDIPVAGGIFDAVVCTEVLEHVPDPIAAVREIARILRPGGTLILTAPQRSGGHLQPYHFYGGFTPSWYRHFLQQFGLTIRSIEPNGGFFKAYGEESQRFVSIVFPAKSWRRRLLFPAYVATKAGALGICFACHWLDRLDHGKQFTVGYHVLASKKA